MWHKRCRSLAWASCHGYKQSKIISQLSNERNYGSDFVAEDIIESIDNEYGYVTLYSVEWYSYKIKEFETPLRKLRFYSKKNNVFENYEDAKKYLINFLKDKISIQEAGRRLLWKREELKGMEKLLEKMKNGSWDYWWKKLFFTFAYQFL